MRTYSYKVEYLIRAQNFTKAMDRAKDLDRRVEKTGAVKHGETRLTEQLKEREEVRA